MSDVRREPGGLAQQRRDRLAVSRLYLVCDIRPGGRQPEELLRPALQGGVDVVQLREKVAADWEILRTGLEFRRLCDAYEALFIVNDRPDLAVACGADGVHLGQDDADPGDVRRVVGEHALIGLSTHSPEQVGGASGVDYIAVGPVHATPTKPEYQPVGHEMVRHAAQNARVPFVAIGGIDAGNVADVIDAGAERVAVVRAICDAEDPARAAWLLRSGIEARLHAGAPG